MAARLEQEIRSYPRLYSGFYTVLNRYEPLRRLAGRVKDDVRRGWEAPTPSSLEEPALLRARREAAVAARLGLRPADEARMHP